MEGFIDIQLFLTKQKKKKNTDLKKILKKNFKYPLKIDSLEEYIKKNINQLIELDENEFWNLKFFNEK